MQRMPALEFENAPQEAESLLNQIRSATGMVSNQMRTMANAPVVLRSFVAFDAALAQGVLSDQERERIALAVAEISGCPYSLDLHCALGRLAGLSEEEIRDSRRGVSPNRRLEAIMQFTRQVVVRQGRVSDADLDRIYRVGCDHAQVAEILANVVLALFAGYFNIMARTARDFPRAPELTAPETYRQSPGCETGNQTH